MKQKDIDGILNILMRRDNLTDLNKTTNERKDYIESIVDRVFIYIEQNLMAKYTDYVSSFSSSPQMDSVMKANMQISRMITKTSLKVPFDKTLSPNGSDFSGLKSTGVVNNFPISRLIHYYTKMEE